jgi:prepilin-type N-terminal cleavage/methylation domain-containing protein
MKIQKRTIRRNAFTLVELITVVSVIVILFGLVVGGYSYADRSSKRSRTEITIKAVRSGLEAYREKFGSYPEPINPDTSVAIADKSYIAGSGACLYQALTGDGFDQIKGASGEGSPESNGNLDDAEAVNVVMTDMPRELWINLDSLYFMADGFGHPLRYIKSAPTIAATSGQQPPPATTINIGTYDIWSYGEDTENINATSLEASGSDSGNRMDAKWIKNW